MSAFVITVVGQDKMQGMVVSAIQANLEVKLRESRFLYCWWD